MAGPWSNVPATWKRRALRAKHWRARSWPGHTLHWGSFRRTTPMSDRFGLDRGLPIDRFYIGEFVGRHRDDIRGAVMEVSRPTYVEQFGSPTTVTVIDIDPANAQATLIADLCEPASLPREAFDCIVLTQTLQYLRDLGAAIENLWSALAPGGVLLMTVPAVSRDDPRGADYWRFTPAGLDVALRTALPDDASITVSGYGNVLGAVAMLHGLSVEETGRDALAVDDVMYPVVACARVVRGAR
ncbi:MAG: class I SAM-dependent methyltransferase [Acidimicrobiia bacterium]